MIWPTLESTVNLQYYKYDSFIQYPIYLKKYKHLVRNNPKKKLFECTHIKLNTYKHKILYHFLSKQNKILYHLIILKIYIIYFLLILLFIFCLYVWVCLNMVLNPCYHARPSPKKGKLYGTPKNLSVLVRQIIKLIVKCVIFLREKLFSILYNYNN